MRILYSPQVNSGKKIEYKIQGEIINAFIDGISDIFDFSEMPDGEAVSVGTSLPINPIVNAKRLNGVLSVELLNFISHSATEKEKFPEWMEV